MGAGAMQPASEGPPHLAILPLNRSGYEKEIQQMRKDILITKRPDLNILLFGPSGTGKSTLGNGFWSAVRGEKHVINVFQTGITNGPFTLGFHPIKLEHVQIIDMQGTYETEAIKNQTIQDIIKGKFAFHVELNEDLTQKDATIANIEHSMPIDCVVIVLRSGMEVTPEVKRQINAVIDEGRRGYIVVHLVVTHLDRIDPRFKDAAQLHNLDSSEAVREVLTKFRDVTKLDMNAVSIIRNYFDGKQTDIYTNHLLLRTLKRLVSSAEAQFDKRKLMRGNQGLKKN